MSAEKSTAEFLETVSGRKINPLDPQVSDIDINDIAWGISRISRFAGHTITSIPYNVAQHSLYVCDLMEAWIRGDLEIQLDGAEAWRLKAKDQWREVLVGGLIHDAHEAYTGDIPSPIKRLIGDAIKNIERALDSAIHRRLGLTHQEFFHPVIHHFDKVAQSVEAYQFMPSRGSSWNLPVPSLIQLQEFPLPLPALESYKLFMEKFEELMES